ncbi:MAG: haloacid dehalogenase [Desulfurococcales archaeon]|nr:haloacid dehalogenase [Desulfurococcales archaeon]
MEEWLSRIIEDVKRKLDELDNVRNEALKTSRDVIRLSGWSITRLLNGDIDGARVYLEKCRDTAMSLLEMTSPYPELYYSGFVNNAVSEYVEAEVFYRIVTERRVPGPGELRVPYVPYLQGLADTVGELRRLALDYLGKRDVALAEELFEWMNLIYVELKGLDYPDSLVPGLRRKVDVARRLVDDTKAFLVDLKSRYELIDLLNKRGGAR